MAGPVSTRRTFIGLAKETTPGTAAAATIWIPCDSFRPMQQYGQLEDKASRGSNVAIADIIQGTGFTAYEMEGPLCPDSAGLLFGGMMGDVATTGGSAPYTHAMSSINSGNGQPPTITVHDVDTNQPRKYAYCVVQQLVVTMNPDSLCTFKATLIGGLGSTSSVSSSASYTSVPPLPAWRFQLSLAGSTVGTGMNAESTFTRSGTKAEHTLTASQSPSFVWADELDVSHKIGVLADSDTEYARYLAGTSFAVDLAATQGSGSSQNGLTIHSTKCYWTPLDKDRGSNFLKYDGTARAAANATDAGTSGGISPAKVTVVSALASGSYG